MEILVLHQNPKYKAKCIELLNSEWPRSEYARSLSFEKNNDDLPVSLVLVRREDDKVIGHSRLCRIPGLAGWCLVESVVVAKDERRKGYGRKLMHASECFARDSAFHTIYLTTHDQVAFYEDCGYKPCTPLITVGSSSKLLEGARFSKLLARLQQTSDHLETLSTEESHPQQLSVSVSSSGSSHVLNDCSSVPAPPPLPPTSLERSNFIRFSTATVSMKKCL
ncbi:unnamed protein product [Soboliphyme baturini]|uniref:N-acetyltransferase domain-containing protein n=1 Tax=Soboliphyme baturini TaxID=241478 RepID=A0A183IK81_9BILA|nr:unnamed protein product [Soboliphyme baturini]